MNISANDVKELREKTGAGMMDCKKALVETNGDMDKAIDYLREKGIAKAQKKADRIAAEGLALTKVEGNNGVILEVNSETDFVSMNEEFRGLVSNIGNALLINNVNSVEEVLDLSYEGNTISDLVIAKTATIGEKLSFRRFEKVAKTETQVFGEYLHLGGKIAVLVVLEGGNEEIAKDVAMHVAAMNPKYLSREFVPQEEVEKERNILTEQAINEGKPEEIAKKMVEGRINKYYQDICLLEQAFIKDSDINVGKYVENNNAKIVKYIRFEVGEGLEKREDNFAEEVMNQMKN